MIKRHRAAVHFHDDADRELTDAVRWYATRNLEIARGFLDEIDHAVTMIAEGPLRWPAHVHGTRRYILRQFPCAIVYRMAEVRIEIVAVAHLHRKPGYWKSC